MNEREQQRVTAGLMERIHAAAAETPTNPRSLARYRLAAVVRRLIDRLVATEAPTETLDRASADVEALLGELGEGHSTWAYETAEAATAVEPGEPFDHSPLIGKANPLAPPMHLAVDDDHMRGTVTFGPPYEGPPGCVHGGYVAAMFDELLGGAQALSGRGGMTGTLSVRYESPTPLQTALTLDAWVERIEGRKIFTVGTCHAGDRLTARAEGIFISVTPEKFGRLREDRAERLGRA